MVTVVVVEIFTTDGINFSAKSANDPGISFEKEEIELLHNNKIEKKNSLIFFLNLRIINNYKTYYCKN